MSKVGIVILNYNDCEETKKYVNSIKRFKSLNEILSFQITIYYKLYLL